MEYSNFFDENRLDVIIKYLYVKAYVENNNYDYYKKLYLNSIKVINGGIEDEKKSIEDFLFNFNKLIDSIKKKGFNKKYSIPIGKDGIILNGAHRLAVCMYFKIEPEFKQEKENSHCKYNYHFFIKSGFKENYLYEVINFYCKLKEVNIFILWEPSKKFWENIKKDIEKRYNILFENTFNLEKNSMRKLIKDMYAYEYNLENNNYIDLKIKNLEHYSKNSSFKVLITKTNKDDSYFKRGNQIVNKELFELKDLIRDKLKKTIDKDLFISLHTNDNSEHSKYLINILYNKNNLNYLNYRSSKFIKKIDFKLKKLENFLNSNNISKDEICIDSGSVLELLGIRESSDLDLISINKYNLKTDLIEFHERDINIDRTKISDKEIINNPNYHFYYKGFKFMNLELVKLRKDKNNKKEAFDIKLIDNFLKQKKHNKINYVEELNFKIRVFMYSIYRKVTILIIRNLSQNQKNLIKKFLNKFFGKNYKI